MIYLITCKNDFPPVNEYKITSHNSWSDLPKADKYWMYHDKEIVKMRNDMIGFVCIAEDPVEAMIEFWSKYMYGSDRK